MARNRKGFTLIELLVVVAVIGILASIAIPKFASTKSKGYLTAMRSDLRNLASAEEAFFADSMKYTSNVSDLKFGSSTGVSSPVIAPATSYWSATVTHASLAGMVCGMGINTTNPTVPTAGDGEPACAP